MNNEYLHIGNSCLLLCSMLRRVYKATVIPLGRAHDMQVILM